MVGMVEWQVIGISVLKLRNLSQSYREIKLEAQNTYYRLVLLFTVHPGDDVDD